MCTSNADKIYDNTNSSRAFERTLNCMYTLCSNIGNNRLAFRRHSQSTHTRKGGGGQKKRPIHTFRYFLHSFLRARGDWSKIRHFPCANFVNGP